MKILTDKPNKRPFLILICLVILALILCGVYWIYTLRVAHSSFENYYNFRGCVQLLEKTDTYGICKLSSGKIIEIVEYQNKWFLDGDLPSGASDPSVVYINTEYGFTFSLPLDWKGYSIVKNTWKGYPLNSATTEEAGPTLLLRNPNWTPAKHYEDIPIMIFTIPEWNSYVAEDFSVSAAPIPASEIARNDEYVFALPPRWDYDFSEGYQEAQNILNTKPLYPFNL